MKKLILNFSVFVVVLLVTAMPVFASSYNYEYSFQLVAVNGQRPNKSYSLSGDITVSGSYEMTTHEDGYNTTTVNHCIFKEVFWGWKEVECTGYKNLEYGNINYVHLTAFNQPSDQYAVRVWKRGSDQYRNRVVGSGTIGN